MSPSIAPAESSEHALRRVARLLRPYRMQALLLSFAAAAGIGAELLAPFLIQHIVDDVVSPRGSLRTLALLVAGFLAARVLIATLEVCRGWVSVWLGGRVAADLRGRLHSRLQHA